ncbi:MAG: hypothetical protein AAFZ58_06305 [Pseudomonadota bacterium]
MAQFVHLADARNVAAIRRCGLRGLKPWRVVFAMPVLEDHLLTHQWLRELRRHRNVPMLAVQFRVPDSELVKVGRFDGIHLDATASQAVAIIRQHEAPFGLQVIFSRKIKPTEITRIYSPPKIVGWRYWPESRGAEPCPCAYFQRGLAYSRRIRQRDLA